MIGKRLYHYLLNNTYVVIGILFALLVTALYLLSAATQNIADFSRLYIWLLAISGLVLLGLLGLIGINLARLIKQYRAKVIGSRLTLRLIGLFILLAVAPAFIVYGFAQQFIGAGIDSWFNERIETALDDALVLSRATLEEGMRERRKQTQRIANEFVKQARKGEAAVVLGKLRVDSGATQLTVWDKSGQPLVTSSADPTLVVPPRPHQAVLIRVQQGDTYVGLEPKDEGGIEIRVALPLPQGDGAMLDAMYPVAERLDQLVDNIQSAYTQYQELTYLRTPLKFSFSLTLALVLLLSLLTAVWAAIFSARRMVAPIRDLAKGTRAVATGDYDTRLPPSSNDELGLLVRSFNDMTEKIARARDAARRSQAQVEAQHSYLRTVLAHLSSGVVTLGAGLKLRTSNAAANQILKFDLEDWQGQQLGDLVIEQPQLQPLVDAIKEFDPHEAREWSRQVQLSDPEGRRQVLMCRAAALPDTGAGSSELVVVFDDITQLIRAQRDAAWGEVARRLAHEIKNPLTPIQLSAERLRHKYLRKMDPKEAELLDRLTHTIVQQVDVMKEMVNAFSDYARTPKMSIRPMHLDQLIGEVGELYRSNKSITLELDLQPDLPRINGDSGRLRQVFHNLIKNAVEATAECAEPWIGISAHYAERPGICHCVEVRIEDNGPGIPTELMDHLFEPYVTNKPKGTGLGLAIVKKIVEEHGGQLAAENRKQGGTTMTLRLPLSTGEVKTEPSGTRDGAQD